MSIQPDIPALYLGPGNPAFKGYYPKWVDHFARDVILEGSLLDGAIQGAEAVRSVVVGIRSLYDRQEHRFAGPYGETGFLEDYVAQIGSQALGCVVLITRNPAWQTDRVVASYRPHRAVLLMSRLLREKFAGAPFAEQFGAGETQVTGTRS
jgi:hypothetical protein